MNEIFWSALATAPNAASAGPKEASNFTEFFVLSCLVVSNHETVQPDRDLSVQLHSSSSRQYLHYYVFTTKLGSKKDKGILDIFIFGYFKFGNKRYMRKQ